MTAIYPYIFYQNCATMLFEYDGGTPFHLYVKAVTGLPVISSGETPTAFRANPRKSFYNGCKPISQQPWATKI